MRRFCLFMILAALPALPALAQESRDFGSPQEALWMLERVIGAMRTDQVKALQLINEGAAGFRELDLYPYCGNDEGLFTAHPELVGTSMRDLRDKRGNPLGEWLYDDREGGCDRPSHLLLAAARVDRHPPEDRSRHPHRRPGLRGRLLSAGPSRQGGTALVH